MRFAHNDFQFEIDDEWWTEAGMQAFVPKTRSYRVDAQMFQNCWELPIVEVEATRRQLSHGVFNDDAETCRSAKNRVISILRGFLDDAPMPPVEVVRLPAGASNTYKLTQGAHRFYLSIAAGFTHVPATQGFEF